MNNGNELVEKMRLLLILLGFSFISAEVTAQLVINEISQGTGTKEYVELVVTGNATCTTPVPCIDLRNIVLDDNNGYFASGSGTGIAQGAIRLSGDNFWSCIPQGTLIVIYNDGDINPAVPADDFSVSDGNCRLVIPVSSNLIEGQSTSPSTSNSNYPPDTDWIAGNGSWLQIGMANGGDSFQLRASINAPAPYHSVSWGNNTNNTQITFSSAAGKVFSFMNISSADWTQQANWSEGVVGTDETPGEPNSAANASWIASMNPSCGNVTPLDVQILESTLSCSNDCDGSLVATASGGNGPYVYNWSNGLMTGSINGLCAGTYTVTVTDQNGCSVVDSGTVAPGYTPPNITLTTNSPYTNQDNPDQLQATPIGGNWYSDCGSCLSANGIFDPQQAGEGSYTVCYIGYNGSCQDTLCNTIEVSGCTLPPVTIPLQICDGDSVLVNSAYIYSDTTFSVTQNDTNGCVYTATYQISLTPCVDVPVTVILPNIFTPNGDNQNDEWFVILENAELIEGHIFNRWGNEMIELTPDKPSWNGKVNGDDASPGIYFVRIKINGTKEEELQGFIELLR